MRLLMTIPGINVYLASAILAKIGDISRFLTKTLHYMQDLYQDRINPEIGI